eukprot:12101141-Ditylum_brightwellii.AAC.1
MADSVAYRPWILPLTRLVVCGIDRRASRLIKAPTFPMAPVSSRPRMHLVWPSVVFISTIVSVERSVASFVLFWGAVLGLALGIVFGFVDGAVDGT